MRLTQEGQTIEKPRDMLKNPLVLEFLAWMKKKNTAKAAWKLP